MQASSDLQLCVPSLLSVRRLFLEFEPRVSVGLPLHCSENGHDPRGYDVTVHLSTDYLIFKPLCEKKSKSELRFDIAICTPRCSPYGKKIRRPLETFTCGR